MSKKLIDISLFGACIVRAHGTAAFEITGSKHKALFVLLATAPFGQRSRAFLQDTLWGVSCFDSGRQSLRRALSDIKALLGDCFNELITTNNTDVILNLDLVEFLSTPDEGRFLEGLSIKEKLFLEWMEQFKVEPQKLDFLNNIGSEHPVRIVPSITVLPLKVILGDDTHSVIGDWVAEEVCRSLSRSNLLHVISHLSSRSFTSDFVDIERVRSVLGADYCVSGTIREDRANIVVDADFISTETSQILWTRQFKAPRDSFFQGALEGIGEIVSAVGGMLASDALRFVKDREIHEIDDHRLLIAAVDLMHKSTLSEFAKSRQLMKEALNRVPNSAETHAWLGKWYTLSVFNGWSSDVSKDTQKAVDCTARALDLNPENSFCLTIDGFAQNNLLQKMDIAEERYDKALSVNPNEALGWLLSGTLDVFRDHPSSAVKAVERAKSLSPIDPFGYFYDTQIAGAYMASKEYDHAIALIERSLSVNNRHLSTMRMKIAALHYLGRTDEAKKTASEFLRYQPDYKVSDYLKKHPAGKFQTGKEIADALSASGIPK